MTANRTAHALARLRPAADATDADLLQRYAAGRDAAAFEAIVRRHAALVFAACRRGTGHAHDAEDAFQAVFLILARNAAAVREPHLLAAWLYGVAVRVARKARTRSPRRREVPPGPEPATHPQDDWSDVGPVIDAELAALPAWYRQAVLLCDVRQQSRSEAAAALGVPEGTLSSRLAKGRKLLAARLARRGVTLAVPLFVLPAAAAVPELLVRGTLEVVAAAAAGGVVELTVSELAREGTTVVRKLLLLGTGVLAATAVGFGLAGDPAKPPPADPPPAVKPAVADAAKPEAKLSPPRQRGIVTVANQLRWVRWSADGKRLVLTGTHAALIEQFNVPTYAVQVLPAAADGPQPPAGNTWTSVRGELVGLDPADPATLIVHVKEEGGINVRNELVRYQLRENEKPSLKVLSRATLADDVWSGLQMTPDGKHAVMVASDEATGTTELREIDPATGRATRVAFRTTTDTFRLLSGNGTTVVTEPRPPAAAAAEHRGLPDTTELHVWDAAANKMRCAWKTAAGSDVRQMALSHDGKVLAVVDGKGVVVVDAVTGKDVRRFDEAADRQTVGVYLSHDGRLTVVCAVRAPRREAAGASPPAPSSPLPPAPTPQFVTVFDTATGKPIKKWETSHALDLAFAPDRATLAVLESPSSSSPGAGMMGGGPPGMGMPPAGEGSGRLGLWDFGK